MQALNGRVSAEFTGRSIAAPIGMLLGFLIGAIVLVAHAEPIQVDSPPWRMFGETTIAYVDGDGDWSANGYATARYCDDETGCRFTNAAFLQHISRGFDNHIVGWHMVDQIVYECGDNVGMQCSASGVAHVKAFQQGGGYASFYIASQHYFFPGSGSSGLSGYTSNDGLHSSNQCFYTAGCELASGRRAASYYSGSRNASSAATGGSSTAKWITGVSPR